MRHFARRNHIIDRSVYTIQVYIIHHNQIVADWI